MADQNGPWARARPETGGGGPTVLYREFPCCTRTCEPLYLKNLAPQVNFASRPLYMLVVTGYKVALCLAYLRILSGTESIYRKLTIALLVFIALSHGVSTLVIVFQCKPVSKSWHPDMDGECLADFPTWIATATLTIVCDIFTFVLPVPLFFSLQISLRRKVVLSVLFVLGFFTTACSIMRMVQIWEIRKTGDNSALVLWAVAKMNVGVSRIPSYRS